jgi:homoserine O-acetyltransferase
LQKQIGRNTRMKILFVAVVWLLVVCACERAHSQSPAQAEGGAQQFATLGEFKLQGGAVVHDFRLGYRTLGKLNVEKSNAVLWPTWLGGRTEDLLEFIGPGKVVDSSKYFVILVDAISDGVSTSPSNSEARLRMKFPKFTIRDMVESEHRLATEVLRLTHLHAVMGLSMGGMQTFEWAVAYPDFMDVTIPMEGSPQSTSYDKLLWTSEIDAIEMDPAWNTGNPTGPLTRGIALEEEIDSMNVTSPAYRVTHTKTESFENFLGEMRKNSRSNAGAVSDQVRQREAIMALDIPREFGVTLEQAAKKIRSRMLVIVSLEDHMVNPSPAVEFASAIDAPVVSLDSLCGHLSLSCISVGPIVAQFLADPASVRSQTLKDPSSR